jgi:hypothetical protein
MTDDVTREPAPPCEPIPTPAPLPVSTAAPRRSRRMAVWIAVGVTAAVALLCGASYLAARWLGDNLPDLGAPAGPSDAPSTQQVPASVWWSGEGRYVVLQAVDEDDVQSVVVKDLSGGTSRTLKGYRVVGVEPHAPRVWLVPDRRKMGLEYSSTESTPQLTDIAWDGIDSPPDELAALRLDRDQDPRADVDARWTPWPGAAGYSASVEIDVNKGGCPASIRFSKVGSSLNAWSAKVPTDVSTFEPIGWSPSGEHFAVITQAGPAETARIDSVYAGSDTSESSRFEAAVLVFKASDGSLASRERLRVPVRDANSGPARAQWDRTADELVMLDTPDSAETPEGTPWEAVKLMRLKPGATASAIALTGEPWKDNVAEGVWLAGSDATATLIVNEQFAYSATIADVYRADRIGRMTHAGLLLGGVAIRWSQAGGFLSLDGSEYGDGTWRVYRSGAGGSERTEVLKLNAPNSTGG